MDLTVLPLFFSLNTPLLHLSFKIDELSLFFLVLILTVSSYIGLFTLRYNAGTHRSPYAVPLLMLFITSMLLVLMSNDSITFLIFWELMSFTSLGFILSEKRSELTKPAFLYFFMASLGSGFIMAAFFLLYRVTSSLSFDAFTHQANWLVLVLGLIGFGTKAGAVPLHVWLPYAHPVAPSNVSALMSGVMVKVALYGVLRLLFVFGAGGIGWLGIVILVTGAVSAVTGIINAFGQNMMKKLLAYSTVENVGIILMGIGASFWAHAEGYDSLASLALLAALLHIINHALFKSALFMGAGLVLKYTHTQNMEELGGLARRLPMLSALFLTAVAAASALPPLNGFIGEWFLYQSLIGIASTRQVSVSYIAVLSIALLSVTGALAAATYVKAYGTSFLGKPRKITLASVQQPNPLEIAAILIPVLLCVILGLYPTPVIEAAQSVIASITGSTLPVTSGVYTGFLSNGQISAIAMPTIMMLAVFAGAVLVLIFKSASPKGVRHYETWACGLTEYNTRAQFSPLALSQALRRTFSGFYSAVSEVTCADDVQKYFRKRLLYSESISDPIEKVVYEPAKRLCLRVSDRFRPIIQTGSINLYVGTIFLALALCLVAYLGVMP